MAQGDLRLFAHERAQVERFAPEREAALLDQACVEEVADERRQAGGLRVDNLEVALPVGRGEVALEQEAREAETLASGVRTSCETMLISSDLWRSDRSRSRRARSARSGSTASDSVIALNTCASSPNSSRRRSFRRTSKLPAATAEAAATVWRSGSATTRASQRPRRMSSSGVSTSATIPAIDAWSASLLAAALRLAAIAAEFRATASVSVMISSSRKRPFGVRVRRTHRGRRDLGDPHDGLAVVVDVRADLLAQCVRAPLLLVVARGGCVLECCGRPFPRAHGVTPLREVLRAVLLDDLLQRDVDRDDRSPNVEGGGTDSRGTRARGVRRPEARVRDEEERKRRTDRSGAERRHEDHTRDDATQR